MSSAKRDQVVAASFGSYATLYLAVLMAMALMHLVDESGRAFMSVQSFWIAWLVLGSTSLVWTGGEIVAYFTRNPKAASSVSLAFRQLLSVVSLVCAMFVLILLILFRYDFADVEHTDFRERSLYITNSANEFQIYALTKWSLINTIVLCNLFVYIAIYGVWCVTSLTSPPEVHAVAVKTTSKA